MNSTPTHQNQNLVMATGASIRATMTTVQAAAALNRKPRTLNKWAFTGTGPVQPVRINGRLAWPSDEIAALTNGGQQ